MTHPVNTPLIMYIHLFACSAVDCWFMTYILTPHRYSDMYIGPGAPVL